MEPVRRGALPDGLYGAELEHRIDEAAEVIRARLDGEPELAMPRLCLRAWLGAGRRGRPARARPSADHPVPRHPARARLGGGGARGELVIGRVGGASVAILSGRAHPYEGWSHRQSTLLLRAVLSLGIETLVLTNASGGVNPEFDPGDVMIISDTINLSGENPLLGPNLDRFGPRFVAMADAWDEGLARSRSGRRRAGGRSPARGRLPRCCPAPPTRPERSCACSARLGADAVGMSTVHELLVARHMGVRVLGFSLVTNKATPDMVGEVTHEEVLAMGPIGAARLVSVLRELLPELV